MKKQLIIIALSLITYLSQSQVVPNIDWVKTFNPRFQRANAPSALDANNNVYVTGYVSTSASNQDLVVLKYDSLGILLWSYIYDNGGNDAGKAIKVSSTGNVYVTGQSYDASSNFDYYTIKLSPTGSVIWSARYDYSGSTDAAVDIKIDEPAAKVYVTGSGFNGSDNDIITLLYDDSNGSLVWNNVYDGGVSGNDDAVGLVIVDNGNFLMIAGNCINSSGNYDIAAINIKNDGSPNWSYYTDGTAGTNDNAKAIIATGANVAICGMVNNNSSNQDYATIVIDALTPSLIWQNNYDVSNGIQSATSLVNDSTGNIAVTGYAVNSGIYEYHTILYSPAGTQLFTNVESTGINNLYIEPRVATDTIAHHFYVSGAKLNTNNDVFVYQIAPSGNTKWREYHNGSSNLGDAATGLVVNGIGVVYLSALSLNTSGNWDIVTMKISQTPVYFPPDLGIQESPSVGHLFIENKGQIKCLDTIKVAKEVLFYTEAAPFTYYSHDKISYKFCHTDSVLLNSRIQRVDVLFPKANKLSKVYPFNQNHGSLSFMQEGLPDAVVDAKGYEHYFKPNIYPSIDLQYYSNANGLKLYYILKPGANINNILWEIVGASSTSINATKLEINSLDGKVVYDKPIIYTVNLSGNAIAIPNTINWTNLGINKYGFAVTSLNPSLPYIIEIDYGNPLPISSPPTQGNLYHCTYYGGELNEGLKSMDVDVKNGNFVALTTGKNYDPTTVFTFPTISGQTLSIAPTNSVSSEQIGIILFNKFGQRIATNIYANFGFGLSTQNIVLSGNLITIVGNNNLPSPLGSAPLHGDLPIYNSVSMLTPGTYSKNVGEGFVLQFNFNETNPITHVGNINGIKWFTRLNGFASDIVKSYDGKSLYITSSTDNYNFTPDLKVQTGSYNSGTFSYPNSNVKDFQISKFDSAGVRKWSTILQAPNNNYLDTGSYNFLNISTGYQNLQLDRYIKCKISAHSNGIVLAGQTNLQGLKIASKYGAPTTNTYTGGYDAFLARFNNNDSLVFSSYISGTGNKNEVFTGVKHLNNNSIAIIGYCNNKNNLRLTTLPTGSDYIDSTNTLGKYRNFIVKFDSLGNKKWGTFFGNNSWDIYPNAIAVDGAENLYISGRDIADGMQQIISNPSNLYTDFVIPSGFNVNTNSYMLAFNKNNQIIWNTKFRGHYEDIASKLIYIPQNKSLVLGGTTNSGFNKPGQPSPAFPITSSTLLPIPYYQADLSLYVGSNWANTFKYDAYFAYFKMDFLDVGIKEYFNDKSATSSFNLFPNPASRVTKLAFKDNYNGKVTISVYNELGQLVIQCIENSIYSFSVVEIDTQSLKTGYYIVKVSNSEKSESKKLIINN